MHGRPSSPVYLVGSGPGDPELLTMKAHRLLREADVVVYDRLVSPEILDCIPAGASRIFVGKAARAHHMIQEDINTLLVRLAQSGRTVVRLKGGDPFVFGRGSEEAAYLLRHSIAFEVVPGVTAASACAASIGVPLTHRGVATGVRFVTGHRRADEDLDLDWAGLADPETTLVVYMGLSSLDEICRKLIAAGMPPGTPAAAISNGTTPIQKSCRATVANLYTAVTAANLDAPLMTIIGGVVDVLAEWQPTGFTALDQEVFQHG